MLASRSERNSSVNETKSNLILLVDKEEFSRGCTLQTLQKAFPGHEIFGCRGVEDLNEDVTSRIVLAAVNGNGHAVNGPALSAVLGALESALPGVPKVLITHTDDLSIHAALNRGIQGLIPSTASVEVAIAAIRLVLAGGTYFPPLLASAMWAPAVTVPVRLGPNLRLQDEPPRVASHRRSDEPKVAFTAREIEVLRGLQRGRSNKWIANELKLSENTIKVYLRHIMHKLKASNRTQVAILAQQLVPDLRASTEPALQTEPASSKVSGGWSHVTRSPF